MPPEKLEREICLCSGVFSFIAHMFCFVIVSNLMSLSVLIMVHIMIWGEDEFFLIKDYTEVIDRYKKKKSFKWESSNLTMPL